VSHRFIVASGVCVLFVACSGSSPVSPAPSVVQPVPGSYVLGFYDSVPGAGLQPVSSLPFLRELTLGAHVKDSSGQPAQSGAVIFEYCSLKGIPTDDITRVDETSSESCANGSAAWVSLLTIGVNRSGDAYMNFGFVRVTPIIGFRFRYVSPGFSISDGTSEPRDVTFHPPS
jgi:hypothetical protein